MIQFEKPADLTTLLAKHCQIQIQKIFFHMLRKSAELIECSPTILIVYSGGRHISLMVRMVGVKIHYTQQKSVMLSLDSWYS